MFSERSSKRNTKNKFGHVSRSRKGRTERERLTSSLTETTHREDGIDQVTWPPTCYDHKEEMSNVFSNLNMNYWFQFNRGTGSATVLQEDVGIQV